MWRTSTTDRKVGVIQRKGNAEHDILFWFTRNCTRGTRQTRCNYNSYLWLVSDSCKHWLYTYSTFGIIWNIFIMLLLRYWIVWNIYLDYQQVGQCITAVVLRHVWNGNFMCFGRKTCRKTPIRSINLGACFCLFSTGS